MNTPIAMLVLGTYLAKSKLIDIFKNKHVYSIALLRLIVVPLIVLAVLSFLPMIRPEVRLVILIASSAPSATILAIFSQKYGHDYTYGAQIISFTNIMCLISIPIIITFAYSLWI
jgi:predicted permease